MAGDEVRKLLTSKFLFFWVLLWASAFFQTPQGDPPHLVYEYLAIYVAGISFAMAILSYLNVGELD